MRECRDLGSLESRVKDCREHAHGRKALWFALSRRALAAHGQSIRRSDGAGPWAERAGGPLTLDAKLSNLRSSNHHEALLRESSELRPTTVEGLGAGEDRPCRAHRT